MGPTERGAWRVGNEKCARIFCTNFLNTARGPGHPGKIPGTSRIPLFETQGRQSFEGGHEVFGHHPFECKTPTPPGGLRSPKLNLCALFSCLREGLPERLAKGWRRVGARLAKGWQRVSLHPPISEFPRRPFRGTGLRLRGSKILTVYMNV